MKKILIGLIFVLFAVSANAAGTFGVGVSSNKMVTNVGVSLMTGVQECLDSAKQIYIRSEFTKVNWGDRLNLDAVGIKTITYWDLPFWNQNGYSFKFGLHFAGDYRVGSGDVTAAFGCEVFKNFWKNTLGVYVAADAVNVSDVDDYFVFSTGIVVGAW